MRSPETHGLEPRPHGPSTRRAGLIAALLTALIATWSASAHSPPAGSVAPPIRLHDLEKNEFDVASLEPRTRVLIFGDVSHEGVPRAIKDVLDVTAASSNAAKPVATVLIISHNDDPAALKQQVAAGGLPSIVLHDPDRKAFGAYRILVMPTVVVIDPEGKIVHSMSGPVQHFRESLSAALLRCAGTMSEEEFQRAISPAAYAATDPDAARAERLIHLGAELVRHGLFEVAESRFREAAALAPDNPKAQLGLADAMLRTGRLEEADRAYRAVAAADHDSIDAAIGMATVQAMRGGPEIDQAELAASELVAKYPSLPRARFLMGLVHERKGNCAAALAEFKRAAELSLGD